MSEPNRDDLRVEWFPPFAMGPDSRKITPEEFDQIARAEGYLRLEGIDVEALRLLERGGWSKQAAEAVRQVLAALDGEGEAT